MTEHTISRPDGTVIERVTDNGDGTGTRTTYDAEGNVTSTEPVTGLPLPAPPTIEDALATVATMVASEKVLDPDVVLDDTTLATLAALFPPWAPGQTVAVGDLRSHQGTIVECVQAHTTQPDWEPDATPALWKVHRATETPQPWVQPVGQHDSYQTGDRVTHAGQTWASIVDNNVWEPNIYGWEPI